MGSTYEKILARAKKRLEEETKASAAQKSAEEKNEKETHEQEYSAVHQKILDRIANRNPETGVYEPPKDRTKSESAQSSPSRGETWRALGKSTASGKEETPTPENVIVPQNYTRNLPISSPAQSFIANRAREQEEEKIGTLAMAIRAGVNDVPSTQKTQFDLPTASAPKTALELEIQRQAGQNGITTTPATDEEIRLAQKYNVSVDDIRSAKKTLEDKQTSEQNVQTVLPGITRPFTAEETQRMGAKKTTGGLKEVSDTLSYTAASVGLGAADTLKNTTNGIRTTVGDIATRGAYSDGYKKIEDYLSGSGISGFAKNVIYTTDKNGKKMVAADWKERLSRALYERTGVPTKIASAYIDTVETEEMLKLLGENVNDKYKDSVGAGAYTIGQQIPGVLLTMGYSAAGKTAEEAAKTLADKISKSVSTSLIAGSVYGSTVNQLARENGYNPANYLNATLQATTEAALESAIGFSDAASFKKLITPTGSAKKTVLKGVLSYLATGAEEGLEEVINVPTSEIIDRMTGVSENTKWIGDGGVFDFKEMLKNGLSGAAVGMFMGGAAAISGINSAVQESKDIKSGFADLKRVIVDLPDAYKPKNRPADASKMTMEDFYAYEAEVAEGYRQYMKDLYEGKADMENAEGDTYNAKLSALEKLSSSPDMQDVSAQADFVSAFRDEEGDTVNRAVDFLKNEIQYMNSIISNSGSKREINSAMVNRANYASISNAIRTNRKEIDKILAETPTQTVAPVQTEPETVQQTAAPETETAEEVKESVLKGYEQVKESVPAKDFEEYLLKQVQTGRMLQEDAEAIDAQFEQKFPRKTIQNKLNELTQAYQKGEISEEQYDSQYEQYESELKEIEDNIATKSFTVSFDSPVYEEKTVKKTVPAKPVSNAPQTSAQPSAAEETQTEQAVKSSENMPETAPAASTASTAQSNSANARISRDFSFAEDFGTAEEGADLLVDAGYSYKDISDKIKAYRAENTAESNAAADRLAEIDRVLVGRNRPEVQKIANAYAPLLKQYGISNVVVEDMPVGRNGYYDRKDNSIHISSRVRNSGAVGRIIVHEFTHRGSQLDMSLANSIVAAMDKNPGSLGYISADTIRAAYSDQISGMSETEADELIREERASHFMERVMEDVNVLDEFRDDRTFLRKILDAIRDFFARNNPGKQEQIQLQKIEKKINDLLRAANVDAEVSADGTLTPGREGVVYADDGEPVADSTDDGTIRLSISTYEAEGREVFSKYLKKSVSSGRLTAEEAQEMRESLEEIYRVCSEFKDKYAPFSAWSDAEAVRDTRGRPVFSVVTPNGEYKMNLDFSLVCKKRRTLDAVFNEMAQRGIIDEFELGQKSVVKINEIIRKHQFETACALCFVDAKRFRQASMADQFVSLYNELVESLVPEDQKSSIGYFNFSGNTSRGAVENGIDTWKNGDLDFSHLNYVMKNYAEGTVEYKSARYIKTHPEARKFLQRGDFMSSAGFDAVKSQNPTIMKLYNSKKGTGGPKAAFGDVQYLNEVVRKAKGWTPEKAYAVGGVRVQSFSDYVPRMVFDYAQMVHDLAAVGLPAHAYTKEVLFAKQFGLTGIKINMSLIPAVADGGIAPGLDADGNYVWAGESFNYDEAVEIQNAEGYTENCGTICVGVSDAHIRKLLDDPNIRMVIPYHKSGLNPIVAHMNKIDAFTDYTGFQNTLDENGKKLSKDFDFNKVLREVGDPQKAVDRYLAWVDEHGYTAKFDEFRDHPNYYKLLEDFTLYDMDGTYVPQRAVKAVFPKDGDAFGSMRDLIEAGLEEDAIIEGRRDAELGDIVDEIENTLPKTEAEIEETAVDQAEGDVERMADKRFSKDLGNHYDYSKPFAEQIDDYKAGNFPQNDTLMVGGTPDIWRKVGFNALPVTINKTHVDYAINGTKDPDHYLGESLLKKLPDVIEHPLAIIQSQSPNNSDRAVVILEMNHNGSKVISAIEVDGQGTTNNVSIASNAMTTLFAKSNALKQLQTAIKNTLNGNVELFYWNKKEASALLQKAGLQLPSPLPQDGFVHSIRDNGSKVKYKFENVTETQQFKNWFGNWQKTPSKSSKVVNSDGTPRVVYHYTNSDFAVFDSSKSGDNQGKSHGDGIYVSTSPTEFAYAGKNKMELYANIRKPFEMQLSAKQADYILDKYASAKHDLDEYNGLYRNHAKKKLMSPSRVFDYLNEYAADNGIKTSDILKDLGFDGVHDGSEWVVFEPNQLKSATDNIGTFATDNPDIRYSRDLETAEQEHARKVQETNEYLKKQLNAHTAFGWAKAVSPAQRKKLAGTIAADIPGVSAEEVSAAIKPVFDLLEMPKRGAKDTPEVRTEEALKLAQKAAETLVNSAVQTELDAGYDGYVDLSLVFKETPLKLSVTEKDFVDKTSYTQWVSRMREKLYIPRGENADGAVTASQFYKDISEKFPEFLESYDPEVSEIVMVQRLAELANEFDYRGGANPFELRKQELAESLAQVILTGYFDNSEYTESAQQEIKSGALASENKGLEKRLKKSERENAALNRKVEKQQETIANDKVIKQQAADTMKLFASDVKHLSREISALNRKVVRLENKISSKSAALSLAAEQKRAKNTLRKLYDKIQHPTRKNHVPEEIKGYIANALKQFDGVSAGGKRTIDATVLDKVLTQIKANDNDKISLSGKYGDDAPKGDTVLNDEVLQRMSAQMDAVKLLESAVEKARTAKVSDEELKRLSIDYMKAVNDYLKMLNGYVNQTNQAFIDGKNVELAEFTDGLIGDLSGKKSAKDFGGKNGFGTSMAQGVRNFANGIKYESVSASMFFEMMGKHGIMLDHTFRSGQDAQNRHLDEYVTVMQNATNGKYSTRVAGGYGNNRINVSIDGHTLDVSKAQLMSLYCLWQRPAARNHLESQGAIFLTSEGKESVERTFSITEDVFDKLMSKLSTEDIRIAQTIQKFLSKQCASWGNEASMKMYGYTMFHEDFYFPIRVSKDVKLAKGKEWGSAAGQMNLEFSSFTNSVNPHSTSAIVIDNIFDVAENHVQRMAAYNAYAPVCHDVQRILKNGTVRTKIANTMGDQAVTYLFKFLERVNGNAANERGNTNTYGWLNKLGNLNKRAAVAANFSSAFKQFDSVFRACDEINPKYLLAARTGFGRQEGKGVYGATYRRMVENSGIAKMKMLGYSDAGFGKSLREQWDNDYVKTPGGFRKLMDSSRPTHAVLKVYDKATDSMLFGMGLASKADETVWVGLYRACELETADKFPNLSAEERTAKATERFNEIIGRTQVVDSVMDSTPFSRNVLGSGFGAFMNEPVKSFGHLLVAVDAMRDKKPGAGKQFSKVLSSLLFASLVVEPLKSALASLLRDNEDDSEQFFRKMFKLYTGVDFTDTAKETVSASGVMSSNLVDGVFGLVPLFGQIYDIVSDVANGYSSSRLETEGLEKFYQYASMLIGYDTKDKIQTKTKAKIVVDLLGATGKLTGLPLGTIIRDVQILPKSFASLTDNYIMQWEMNKWFYNLGSGTARINNGFYNIMADVIQSGDTDAYRYIRNDLEGTRTGEKAIGVTFKKVKDEMEKRKAGYVVGSELFLEEIQAEFNLPTRVSDKTAEKAIAQVYAKALKEMSNDKAAAALPSTPGVYSYTPKDENGDEILDEHNDPVKIEMTNTEYAKFIEDVGLISRNIISKFASSNGFKSLSTEDQMYCLDKAYDFAARYYRSKFNPDYDISAGGKWMAEVSKGKLDYTTISRAILSAERKRK